MSRLSKFLLVTVMVVFALACGLITNPINDVKNTANTAQAFATDAIAIASQAAPFATVLANPSLIPDVGNFFDPQGTPVTEWNGIPVMPQATAGQEFNANTYSFKATASSQDAQDFYNGSLPGLGWNQAFSAPGNAEGAILIFSKDSSILTITISLQEGSIVVILALA